MRPKVLVGQSGGPTPVINASLAGFLEEVQHLKQQPVPTLGSVFGLRHGIEGALAEDIVSLDHIAAGQLDALARTPAAALGSCRHKLTPGEYERILSTFRRHEVRWFCYIGGNDSMDTCHRLQLLAADAGYELAVFGIPKTIDNDLVECDHCPGYGSAARFWAVTTQEATLDLAAMRTYDRVLIVECMGRNAGWLPAASAIYKRRVGDGPHVLLTPERAFDEPAFLAGVDAALTRLGYCVVAAGETIRDAAGEYVTRARAGVDRFGHPIVTAVGETLAQLIAARLHVKARSNKPGTLQRSSEAHVSAVDREEARHAGREAARRLARGEAGGMVTLLRPEIGPYHCQYGVAPLENIANRERRLPDHYLAADGSGVTPAFVDYASPLLGAAPEPYFQLA